MYKFFFLYSKTLKDIISKNDYGQLFFFIATFFLPSAPFISTIFYLISIIIAVKEKKYQAFNFRKSPLLFIASFLMILKSIFSYLSRNDHLYMKSFCQSSSTCWDPLFNFIGLANWIPLFILFFCSINYLITEDKRRLTAKIFIAGTVPVFISCINQYWFESYGPFEIFNGLIKWYQKSGEMRLGKGISGLFSNPNYTGAWLSMIFPLSLPLFIEKLKSKNNLKALTLFVIISLFSISIFLTQSRGAILALLISSILFFRNNFKTLLTIILIPFLLIFISLFYGNFLNLENLMSKINWLILNDYYFPRLEIWSNSIKLISEKPIFGWGSSTFSYIYNFKNGVWYGHAHNVFIDLALSYGLIVALCLLFFSINLLLKSLKKIQIKQKYKSSIDRGWWLSSLIFFIAQFYDVLYYDFRINIACWIFLAGLYAINKEYPLSN